jgi:hypothetical protein
MRNAVYIVLLAGVALAWEMAGIAARSSGKSPFADIPFEHVIIDGHPPLNQWAIGVADIDGDGQVDIVSSGEGPLDRGTGPANAGLYWYEYPTWAKHAIDADGTFADA